jgi:hypothetical protein
LNIGGKDLKNGQNCSTPCISKDCIFAQVSSECEPDLSSKGMKGCCKQYTIVHFYQRQETGELGVCLNSATSYPAAVFNSLFILMWQINRYGWSLWEGSCPLIELAEKDALLTTPHAFAILLAI